MDARALDIDKKKNNAIANTVVNKSLIVAYMIAIYYGQLTI